MTAFYNEIDQYAARWLEALVAAGHITEGHVERRSIRDLTAAEVASVDQAHFFAGIGVWSRALRLAGWPDGAPAWTGSCPCQPFSSAGQRRGEADDRHLWPVWFRLIEECRPSIVFGEQVASADGVRWLDAVLSDLEGAGYSVGAADLCAAGVGAPHLRQRLFFVAVADHDLARQRLLDARRKEVPHADGGRDARVVVNAGGARGRRHARADARAERARPRGGGDHWDRGNIVGAPVAIGELVDAEGERRDGRAHTRANGRARGTSEEAHERRSAGDHEPPRPSDPVELADAGHRGRTDDARELPSRRGQPDDARGGALGMADYTSDRRHERRPARSGDGTGSLDDGLARGFWEGCEWVWCRDGVWRPVEPGTFPLAHGSPARVGRLRAYGNAIVPQVAATFVRSVMDTILGIE